MFWKPVAVLAVLLVAVGSTGFVAAPVKHRSTALTVVEKGNLSHGAHTVILVRAHAIPHTIVMVDPDSVTPDDLAAAFHSVNSLRQRIGANQKGDLQAVPKANAASKKPRTRNSAERARMEKYLHSLSISRPVQVNGLGTVKAINVAVAGR
jgi:hypothetical protein